MPDAEQRLWRTVMRRKYQVTRNRVQLQNRLECLLEEAHLKLSSLVSDLLGLSARRILQALADGETNPDALVALADYRLRATPDQLGDALSACADLHYDIQQRKRVLRQLRQRAATLGFELVNRETGEVLEPAISQVWEEVSWEPLPLTTAYAYAGLGRHDEAITLLESELNSARGHRTLHLGLLSWSYVAAGRRGDAERFVGRLEEERRATHVPGSTLALATLGLGDHAGALRWLEASVDERDPNLINVVADPHFEPLHAEPRDRALLRTMNLAQAGFTLTRVVPTESPVRVVEAVPVQPHLPTPAGA